MAHSWKITLDFQEKPLETKLWYKQMVKINAIGGPPCPELPCSRTFPCCGGGAHHCKWRPGCYTPPLAKYVKWPELHICLLGHLYMYRTHMSVYNIPCLHSVLKAFEPPMPPCLAPEHNEVHEVVFLFCVLLYRAVKPFETNALLQP